MLSDDQKKKVAGWISEGLTLSQIQDRMAREFEIRMTYMEARLLVDDLKLLPRETVVDTPKPAEPAEPVAGAAGAAGEGDLEDGAEEGAKGDVSVKVDTLTRPGAMVSGSVTFSDGQAAQWYVDQMGRLGMVPPLPGYRPPQQDIPVFQMLLDKELSRAGM